MPIEEVNNYFSLDIKLPSCDIMKYKPILRTKTETSKLSENAISPSNGDDKSMKLNISGFIDMLENVHMCKLREDNPWLNPRSTRIRKKYKQVRFATMELCGDNLPNCRNYNGKVKKDSLHTMSCPNIEFETIDVLGQQNWQNRQFIMSLSNHEGPSITRDSEEGL